MVLIISSCGILPKPQPAEEITFSHFAKIPSVVNECSGMVIVDNDLYMINDGGAGAFLYRMSLNNTDSVESKVVTGGINRDWEVLSLLDDRFVIGDIGNNKGRRKDMVFYHVDMDMQVIDSVGLVYPDQTIFTEDKHNFDCEGIIIKDDKYVVFTKNRGDEYTNVYTAEIGTDDFAKITSVEMPGDVTDACYDEEADIVLLTCYRFSVMGFKNFLVVLKPTGDSYEVIKEFELKNKEQIEAITKLEKDTYLLGSEDGMIKGGNLYKIKLNLK